MTALVKPMLAAHTVRFRPEKKLIAEPKADGYRILGTYTRDGWIFYSREHNQEPYTSNLQFLVSQLPRVPVGTTLDGELAMNDFKDVAGWRREYLSEEEIREMARDTVWMVFDIYDAKSKRGERLGVRKGRLRKLISNTDNVMLAPEVRIKSEAHLTKVYRRAIANGWEGLVVKDLDDVYVPGMRRDAWAKMKARDTRDGKIIGFNEGKGQDRGMLGSLIVDCEGKEVKVSGFPDKFKRDVWAHKKKYLGRWVEFSTLKGKWREPKFVKMRPDRG